MDTKSKRGGARSGSGRPAKYGERTHAMRVPVSRVAEILALLAGTGQAPSPAKKDAATGKGTGRAVQPEAQTSTDELSPTELALDMHNYALYSILYSAQSEMDDVKRRLALAKGLSVAECGVLVNSIDEFLKDLENVIDETEYDPAKLREMVSMFGWQYEKAAK
jgi:hypothetical protein